MLKRRMRRRMMMWRKEKRSSRVCSAHALHPRRRKRGGWRMAGKQRMKNQQDSSETLICAFDSNEG